MKFKFVADVTFDADDLQHACELISDHFLVVGDLDTDDRDTEALDMIGSMELKPIEQYVEARGAP
jgi:hypothetical protein